MAEPAYDFLQSTSEWPEQGSWTWEDYLRLPDDGQRYEIIHGVLYVSPAPRYIHQFAASRLLSLLHLFVFEGDLGVVLTAPFDVRLPGIANPVQPDIVYLAKDNMPAVDAMSFQGVPNLVVEVLSPGTSRVDLLIKRDAYETAKIDEYWIVDPDRRTVTVHVLDGGRYRELDSFGNDDHARSAVLPGFKVAVAMLFPQA